MAITEETLALVAATLTAAIIEQDCIDDPPIRKGDFLVKHATTVFGEVLEELRVHHIERSGREVVNKAIRDLDR